MRVHIMVDLETLGLNSNAVIVSAGLVAFDRDTFKELGTLEVGFDLNQQIKTGGIIDGDTIEFHFKQEYDSIQRMANREVLPVKDAIDKISAFVNEHKAEALWGNGATFDNVILRNLYTRFLRVFPLPFWADRDLRTAVDMGNVDTREIPFVGIQHYSLDDALHQVKILKAAIKK